MTITMNNTIGRKTIAQCFDIKLAATLTILVASEILLLKQQIMSTIRKAKIKQITAAMILPTVPDGFPVTGFVGATSR